MHGATGHPADPALPVDTLERDYRLLAAYGEEVISRRSPDGRWLYVSPAVERVFGRDAAFTGGPEGASMVFPDDLERLRAAFAAAAAGEPQSLEYRGVHADGHTVWVDTRCCLAQDGSGEVITIARDISARKRLEQDLTQALEHARSAMAAKGDFLANMTHELRTPLTAIIGFSGILKEQGQLNGPDARRAELIHDASNTLLSVVNSVLDFSKLEAGGFDPELIAFSPSEMTRSMCALVADQARAKGLDFNLRMEGSAEPLLGDAPRLGQVLLNFLSNAIKFTQQGGVEVTLSQGGEGAARRLRLAVRDSGIGIPAADVGHVFGRFTQADASVSRRFGGTGLGLAIAKRVIEHMGGSIGAQSQPGQGSTFWFELDLTVAEAPSEVSQASEPVEQADTGRPPRLLVVEDNAVNRELLSALLEAIGAEVYMAFNGVEAIEMMQAMRFDLVLMDMQMPVMDGLTATARIRSFYDAEAAATPIIAMTANVLPEQVERCKAAGMNDHVGKPIEPAKLFGAIARWMAVSEERERKGVAA
jgi:PAS domain S-box-containing protein